VNGVHDVGGMHGFGPIRRDDGGSPFHASWEGRVHGMMAALIRLGVFNLDEMRRAIESIPPARYLASGYYDRWLEALGALAVEKGRLTPAEIDAARERFAREPLRVRRLARRDDPARAAAIRAGFTLTSGPAREPVPPRFHPGDRVRAKNRHVREHTRLPRYVRGKRGIIHRIHGTYIFPDTNAHGRGKNPQPVYSVRFEARDLWADDAPRGDAVYIDLWESYLDPA
jgi:nitrile hydratase subunit beta